MLELKNVSWSVEDENGINDIINDISLTLDENKLYVVTGPNGGGKSTLAKLIMGILEPTSGQILFNGIDILGIHTHIVQNTKCHNCAALRMLYPIYKVAYIMHITGNSCQFHLTVGMA